MLTEKQFNTLAEHIYKDKTVRDAVRDVIFKGSSYYQAERDNDAKINTLSRHMSKYKKEVEYLTKLGLVQ